MADFEDGHDAFLVVHLIDDAIVPLADAVTRGVADFLATPRTWLPGQVLNSSYYSRQVAVREFIEVALTAPGEINGVAFGHRS